MKSIKTAQLIGLLLLGLGLSSCAKKVPKEDIINTLSASLCECIASSEYKDASETGPCEIQLFDDHYNLIRQYYNTFSLSENEIDDILFKIRAQTAKSCQYIKDNFPTGHVGERREKQEELRCDDLKNGDFYYLVEKPGTREIDSLFFSIENENYTEWQNNRTTYTRCTIIWKDPCSYDLIFRETDDPFRKEFFEVGQVLSYQIIANEPESYFVETEWDDRLVQVQIFKVK